MISNSAANKAYEYLYQEIASGRLEQGSPISEVELATTLSMSRSPIREALRRMEAEGLVKHYPGRGTFISVITVRDLEEIFQIRKMIELEGLRFAIDQISDDMLDSIAKEFEKAHETGDFSLHAVADARLHSMLVQCTGNVRLQNFMDMQDAQIKIVKSMSRRIEALHSKSFQTHIDIIESIKKRDLALASERLENHIDTVERLTIENLRSHELQRSLNAGFES